MTELVKPKTKTEAAPKFPVLISYALIMSGGRDGMESFRRFAEHPEIEVLLDSGAFTALNAGVEIKLDDYMRFLEEWAPKLFGYLALDVLGDPVATDKNLQTMLTAGFRPVPVHVRGDDQHRMDQLFEWSEWVALGGLRRPHVGWGSQSYVKQKMIWARGRDVHWLGYTNQRMVRGLSPFSCDSSNWAEGFRYGNLCMYLGNWRWVRRGGIRPHAKKTALDDPFSAEEIRFFAELGFDAEYVRVPEHWRQSQATNAHGHVPGAACAWSQVKYTLDVRRLVGTRQFIACAMIPGQTELLINMIEKAIA